MTASDHRPRAALRRRLRPRPLTPRTGTQPVVRRAQGARTPGSKRSVKMRRPQHTEPQRKRRARSSSRTGRPDIGRSARRRW